MRHAITNLMLALAFPLLARATDRRDQMEELPPPKSEQSVLAKAPPKVAVDEVIIWGLTGTSGRHYFTGGTAIADYVRDGARYLAQLEAEDHSGYPVPDDNFLYYRETRTGHRWAFARQASADRQYRVYFRSAGEDGRWQLFQRAQATWDQPFDAPPATVAYPVEASCGRERAGQYELNSP